MRKSIVQGENVLETKIKEKPILFSAPMVRAILDGSKTQTRRIVSAGNSTVLGYNVTSKSKLWQDLDWTHPGSFVDRWKNDFNSYLHVFTKHDPDEDGPNPKDCRRYRVRCRWQTGMHLWLKETAYIAKVGAFPSEVCTHLDDKFNKRLVGYAATMDADSVRIAREYGVKCTPSIFMPRWASRITLEITDVRVERVQEISEADAQAEGVEKRHDVFHWLYQSNIDNVYRRNFAMLWEQINGAESWASNPWVWVVSFKRVTP